MNCPYCDLKFIKRKENKGDLALHIVNYHVAWEQSCYGCKPIFAMAEMIEEIIRK